MIYKLAQKYLPVFSSYHHLHLYFVTAVNSDLIGPNMNIHKSFLDYEDF